MREYRVIDRARFEAEIRPLGQPAILRGIGAEWPAVRAAAESPEAAISYLMGFADPNREVQAILGAPEIDGRFFYSPDMRGMNFTRGNVSLAAFFDRLLREHEAARPFAMALQSEVLPQLMPGFPEANQTPLVDPAVPPRLWIGNRIRVATHYDLKENIGIVIAGRRRFTLFPPEQVANLYMGPIELTPAGTPVSMVDPAAPDLARYPRFAEAAKTAQVAELEEGDGIYIPFHWWHAVDSLDRVNAFVNYWWTDAQPGLGAPYDALAHALLAYRGLPAEQRAVWRTMFDHLVFALDGPPLEHVPPHARGILGTTTPELLARIRGFLRQIFGA